MRIPALPRNIIIFGITLANNRAKRQKFLLGWVKTCPDSHIITKKPAEIIFIITLVTFFIHYFQWLEEKGTQILTAT